MARALCLSGGGAQGSFQMGAIKCLYERFGFRPDLIVGTSVGAVNGIKLAEGNTPDTQRTAMQELESQWWGTIKRDHFFTFRPEFSRLEGIFDSGLGGRIDPSLLLGLTSAIVPATGGLGTALLGLASNELKELLHNLETLNSLCVLDPVETRLRDSRLIDLRKVANGTPLFLATVSLETGALRYVTGRGNFVERDGTTPVASALDESRLHLLAFSGNAVDQATARSALADFLAKQAEIAALKEESATSSTTNQRRVAINDELHDLVPKAETALHRLQAAIRNHPGVTASVSIVDGTIASAAIPGVFGGKKMGAENYVDGGIREQIPVEIAVSQGADDIVAISASSNALPHVDSFDRAGVLGCLGRGFISVAIAEIYRGDLAGLGPARNLRVEPSLTVIAPTFDVHSGLDVIPSLIEISMDYGFMRAGDVMARGLGDEARADAVALSNALTRLRLDLFDVEIVASRTWTSNPGHQALQLIRVRKWAVKHLVAERSRRQLAVSSSAGLWSHDWERDFRPASTNAFGIPNPWGEYVRASETTPAASFGTYEPDGFTIEDRASGARFELVRGALFPTTAAARGTRLVLPADTARFLPRIPPGRNMLVAAGQSQQWFCDGRRRFLIESLAVAAAIGMSSAPVATVPAGGLDQIPDGGPPFFAGGLVVIDNLGTPVLDFEITRRENSDSTFTLNFLNRSSLPIEIREMTPTFEANAGVSVVDDFRPPIQPGTSRRTTFRFRPTSAGSFASDVDIRSNASPIPNFRFPMTLIASPEGPHGELSLAPSPVTFQGRFGQTQTTPITLTNVGSTDGFVSRLVIDRETAPGTFQVSSRLPSIAIGQSDQLPVSCVPQSRGRATGQLTLDFTSTSLLAIQVVETYRVQLTSSAVAPVIAVRRTRPAPDDGGEVLVPGSNLDRGLNDRFGGIGGTRIDRGGTGRGPVDPRVVPTTGGPLDVDLGVVSQGVDAHGSFFVGNLGDADMTVTGIALRDGGFYGDPIDIPFVVPPGDWREIAVHTGTGGLTQPGEVLFGEWRVLSDDASQPDVGVTLHVQVSGPKLTLTADFIDFGAIAAGAPASRELVLTNTGNRPVTIDGVKWAVKSAFLLTLPAGIGLPTILAPQAPLRLMIRVDPKTPTGVFVDYLSVLAAANVPSRLVTGFQVSVY